MEKDTDKKKTARKFFNLKKVVTLTTDASEYAVTAIISQEDG